MPHLVMSPQLFVLFSTLVEESSGIQYGAQDQQVFASKLTDHALELGLRVAARLLLPPPLRRSRRQRDAPARSRCCVVHETYFFRELPPLIELSTDHLAQDSEDARARPRVVRRLRDRRGAVHARDAARRARRPRPGRDRRDRYQRGGARARRERAGTARARCATAILRRSPRATSKPRRKA